MKRHHSSRNDTYLCTENFLALKLKLSSPIDPSLNINNDTIKSNMIISRAVYRKDTYILLDKLIAPFSSVLV